MAARLCDEERRQIEFGIRCGESNSEIAVRLGRSRSTVWREVDRWCRARKNRRDAYRAGTAIVVAARAACRPRVSKLAGDRELAARVRWALQRRWSPASIAAHLRSDRAVPAVCAETIYRAVYANDPRRGLPAGLWRCLPRCRRRRRPRSRGEQAKRRHRLGDFRSISTRPACVWSRTEPGHWEGDLIAGKGNRSAVVTLIERLSRYTILGDLPDGRDAQRVLAALLECFEQVPHHLRRSLAWDQGSEMVCWQHVESGLALPVYFADPHCPWQRPTNEQNNGLLRRWLPKGADLSSFGRRDLDIIQANLNDMPRRSLRWQPATTVYHRLCCDHR